MGSTFFNRRYDGGRKVKNEEELGLWCSEDDSFGHFEVYMEEKESSDFFLCQSISPFKIPNSTF